MLNNLSNFYVRVEDCRCNCGDGTLAELQPNVPRICAIWLLHYRNGAIRLPPVCSTNTSPASRTP
jgi:hypothetical protein